MKKKYFLMASLLMFINVAFSQNIISGKVFDEVTKEPLVGVIIIIPKSQTGVTTNVNGQFTLFNEQSFDSIEVRFIGYKAEKFKVEQGNFFNIALVSSTTNMQEVVVTASRDAQIRSDVPLAINKISATIINDTKPTLIAELINKVSGVAMLNLNNEQRGMSIRQPMGTSNYYLYMEDGIPI